jgi:hypothetical protein
MAKTKEVGRGQSAEVSEERVVKDSLRTRFDPVATDEGPTGKESLTVVTEPRTTNPEPSLYAIRLEVEITQQLQPHTYLPDKVGAFRVDPDVAVMLQELRLTLQAENRELRQGRRVETPHDAVRWLLEKLCDSRG